jgi:tetratricopeptide (TPR) repeat protein/tRNA A-37 threonylcarbamoyl transferase component Bud32
MSGDPRVRGLVEEILETHRTPEDVCQPCPELLSEVRDRLRRLRELEAQVDSLFPTSGSATGPFEPMEGKRPEIPGYDVQAMLGRGGMGVVYKARHLRLNRLVALKMLRAGAYARADERARFQREAEAVASLDHPNIVEIYDVGDDEGFPFFTMELLEGGSLAQALSGTPQPARQAAALLNTLAEAVQVAHQAGIVHRDLKPGNILLTGAGTPKIADFGLARHFEGEPALTLSGIRLGTPSFMAPEQVSGKAGTIGPATDIYALGAILYEMLTGRPPFRGETAAETERQVIHEEPVSPSRLNTKVPRDLETICLKSLSKEPQRRYANAAALADDLKRFAEGRPIRARPVSWVERFWRWYRRNPATAALLVTALALVGLASGGGVWLMQQRAELRNEVVATVAQAVSLRQGFHFRAARQLLARSRQRVERRGPDDLRRWVDQARADVNLVERLDDARTQAAKLVDTDGIFSPAAAEPLYISAFADAGLGRDGDDIAAVVAAVRARAVRGEIVAALDDWASLTEDLRRREWLLAVARGADPDGVRDRLRQPELWLDAARLTRVARELRVAELSPQLAAALGRVSRKSGGEAIALLTATQNRFPQDFWVTFELAWALNQERRRDEALGYFRAALALRPDSSTAYNGLAEILRSMGRADDAIAPLQHALRLDPKNVLAHYHLAFALFSKGQFDGAIDHFQQALRFNPNSAALHNNLGMALQDRGRLDEAIDHLRQSVSINPKSAHGQLNLGFALYRKGRMDEAFGHLQQAVDLDPNSANAHANLAVALRDRGRVAEAVDHVQQAVRLEGEKPTEIRKRLVLYRHDAACANVQTATGPVPEEARRGEPERADKRRQALDWLRANLELTVRLRNDGEVLAWSLATWLSDPALATVRDAAALAKLPDAERESWQRLWQDVAASLAADPLEQGRRRAALRQWDRALDGYARNLARGPTASGHFWFEFAALSLLSGDRLAYSRACARMTERSGRAGAPRPFLVARMCTLAGDAVADASLPGRLAEKELKDSGRAFWSLTEQGALAYRAGRFQEAVPFFEQSLQADPKPGRAVLNWLWLALANQRLGRVEEARRWLNKARAWLDQYRDGMPARAEEEFGLHLHNWLEAHVLSREAEALIESEAPRNATESRDRGTAQK